MNWDWHVGLFCLLMGIVFIWGYYSKDYDD